MWQLTAELVGSDRKSERFETSDPIANLVPTRERLGHQALGARDARHCHRVSLCHMQDERELRVELERERRGTEIAPIRLAPRSRARHAAGGDRVVRVA